MCSSMCSVCVVCARCPAVSSFVFSCWALCRVLSDTPLSRLCNTVTLSDKRKSKVKTECAAFSTTNLPGLIELDSPTEFEKEYVQMAVPHTCTHIYTHNCSHTRTHAHTRAHTQNTVTVSLQITSQNNNYNYNTKKSNIIY